MKRSALKNTGLSFPAVVEIYYLKDGRYELTYSYILQDDKEDEHYNADTIITLKDFPNISMTLAEIFENVEE